MKSSFQLFAVSFIIFIASLADLYAQNKNVVILGGIGHAVEPKDFNISKAPEKLPDVSSYNTTWENILECGLNSFSLEYQNYQGEVISAYSILGLGNYIPFLESLRDKFIYEVAGVIFRNPFLREITYDWVRPYYSDAFDALSYTFQIQYIEILRNSKAYLDGFDYNNELADLKKNEDGFARQKGKINAFIFRRIHNKQMTLDECSYWINKILKDFESHLKDAHDPRSYCEEITTLKGGCNLCKGYFKTEGKYYDLKYKMYDSKFQECNLPLFDKFYEFGNDYFVLGTKDKKALITQEGIALTEFKYSELFSFNNYGLATVCMKKIFTDTTIAEEDMEAIYPYPPYDVWSIKKGDTIFSEYEKDLWGFIDKNGKEILSPEYTLKSEVMRLSDPVTDVQYDQMFIESTNVDFSNGVEVLHKGEYFGLADFSGEIIIPFSYKSMIEVFADDKNLPQLLIVNEGGEKVLDEVKGSYVEGGKWALMDIKGKNITGFIYDKLEYISDDQGITLLYFKRGKRSGSLDCMGKEHKKRLPDEWQP
jgi:hypothetical protein